MLPLLFPWYYFQLWCFFLMEDILFCFNTYNKTNSLFRQEHNNSI